MAKIIVFDQAVSPVIAIMLMLVVTIIIAAVVSGFAGGLAGAQEKTPQATILATYSQSKGMSITHNGGDRIPTLDTDVNVRATNTFGFAKGMSWTVNRSVITNSSGTTWTSLGVFSPGNTVYVKQTNLSWVQMENDESKSDYLSDKFGFAHPAFVDRTIEVVLVDRGSGREIANTQTAITN